MNEPIRPGRYRHFRGKEYQVYSVAKHSETNELLVVYRCLYGERDLWVRPLSMFLEDVEIQTSNGQERVPRFEFVADIGEDGDAL